MVLTIPGWCTWVLSGTFRPKGIPGSIVLDANRAFIALSGLGRNGQVAVLDRSSNNIVDYIFVGLDPWGMAIANGKLYVTNNGRWNDGDFDSVTVININTLTVIVSIPVEARPYNIDIDSITQKAYVTHNSSTRLVTVIDTSNDTVISTIQMSEPPSDVMVVGSTAFVTTNVDSPNGSVVFIDTFSDQIKGSLAVGRGAEGIASLNGYVFVANKSDGTITVIETNGPSVT
jgi:YVTN family beta-propeller protein